MSQKAVSLSRRQLLTGSIATGLAFGLSSILGCSTGKRSAANSLRLLPKTPGFYPFKVGEIQGTVLSDGTVQLPIEAVVTNGNPAEVSALLESNFLPTNQVNAALNTAILTVGGKNVLIDTGYGDEGKEFNGFQEAQLRAAGLTPEQVNVVFLTHAHPDHMSGLVKADGTALYPNAELVIHENEYNFWNGKAREIAPVAGVVSGFDANVLPLKNQLRTVKGGEEIAPGISVYETPGHTPGHSSVLLSSGKDQLLLTADVANHHILFLKNPDYHFSYDFDPDLASKTRRALLEKASAERLRILAYHFPFPGIGYVKTDGARSYQFVPEVWG